MLFYSILRSTCIIIMYYNMTIHIMDTLYNMIIHQYINKW